MVLGTEMPVTQVCCRPCRVRVSYDDTGVAEVSIEEMPCALPRDGGVAVAGG